MILLAGGGAGAQPLLVRDWTGRCHRRHSGLASGGGASLHDHVAAVAGLWRRAIWPRAQAVSMIVGRDPDALDKPGIARAAAESLAENTSDGVIAPLFWGASRPAGNLRPIKRSTRWIP
jgi:adenosylcobinamide-phosphate synthase